MRHHAAQLALAAVALTGNLDAFGQSAAQPTTQSMTPGSVALLGNAGDAAAAEQLRTALLHQDATVRAVAARVAGIGRARGLAIHLKAALAKEVDETAASEEVRALLYLGDADSVAAVEAHLPQARTLAVVAYLEWLALTRPENAPERLERVFKSLNPSDLSLDATLVGRAIAQAPDSQARPLRAWLGSASPLQWRAVLETLRGEVPESDASVIQQALKSDNPETREQTVWEIVERLARGRPVPSGVLESASTSQDGSSGENPAAPATWELFGRELVARRQRQARTPDRSSLIRTEVGDHRADGQMLGLFNEITDAERKALIDTLGETLEKAPLPPASGEAATPRGQSIMRTAPIAWPGLLADLLRVSGCRVTNDLRAGAFEIQYRPDGRPLSFGITRADLPVECDQAIAALARLTLADVTKNIIDPARQRDEHDREVLQARHQV